MATMSWSKATQAAPETQTQGVPEAGTTAVGAYQPENDNVGEDRRDLIKYPYLSLFSAKSNNAEEFPSWIGTWVYDKTFSLGKEIVLVPVRVSLSYQEKTEFGSGEIPERWATLKEAVASGLPWQEVGSIQALIEVPEGNSQAAEDGRVLEFAGKKYLPVEYTVRSSAFGAVYRTLRTDYDNWLAKGAHGARYGKRYANGQYLLGIKKVTGQAGPYLVPTLKGHGYVADDVRAEIKEKFGF